jgi:hypothetical protein
MTGSYSDLHPRGQHPGRTAVRCRVAEVRGGLPIAPPGRTRLQRGAEPGGRQTACAGYGEWDGEAA